MYTSRYTLAQHPEMSAGAAAAALAQAMEEAHRKMEKTKVKKEEVRQLTADVKALPRGSAA